MTPSTVSAQIVILNGPPRSGKSSIASAIQDHLAGVWVNLGVDAAMRMTPTRLAPGMGLRPGAQRPDLEDLVVALYLGLYESIAAHARVGLNVVVDVGHHEAYSRPLGILSRCARHLKGLPVLFVGVRCPIEVIWERRRRTWGMEPATAAPDLLVAVERWQEAVHAHGLYDLEVDTSLWSPERCAEVIGFRLAQGPPGRAFHQLASKHEDAW